MLGAEHKELGLWGNQLGMEMGGREGKNPERHTEQCVRCFTSGVYKRLGAKLQREAAR